jgi:hypothetical protein
LPSEVAARPIDTVNVIMFARTLRTVVVFVGILFCPACLHRHSTGGSPDVGRSPSSRTDYQALGSGHFIRSVAMGGQFITLEDGSLWEVEPNARFEAADWKAEAPVTVRAARDRGQYPYELTNTQEDEGVRARYVSGH